MATLLKMYKVWVDGATMVHGPGHLTETKSAEWIATYRKINPGMAADKIYTENTYRGFDEWKAKVDNNLAYVAPVKEFAVPAETWKEQFAAGMRPSKAAAIAIDEWQAALKFKHV